MPPRHLVSERLQGGDEDLREGRERLDGVPQHVERDVGADRQRGLLQPLPRLRPEGVGTRQAHAIADHGQVAVALGVGVRVRRGLGDIPQQCSAAEAVVGNADRRRLRVGVGDPRDRFVVGLSRLPEDVGRHDLPLVLADVGQRPESGDIADSPEVLRHAEVCVDRDAAGGRLDAHRVEAEPLDPWPSPGGDQQPVTAQFPAVVEHHDVVLAVAPGRGHADVQSEFDALTAQDLAQRLTERSRVAGEHVLGPIDDDHLAA